MARTVITASKILSNNSAIALVAAATIDGTDGAEFSPSKPDEKTIFMVKATTGCNLTITKGNGFAGVANLVIAVTGGATKLFQLDSAAFKNVSGTDKGKIIFSSSQADTVLSVFELR